jgi:phycobilisome core component
MDYYSTLRQLLPWSQETPDVLDERVLTGLRETYNSLGSSHCPHRGGHSDHEGDGEVKSPGSWQSRMSSFVDQPFDYMCRELSEVSV